MDTDLRQRVEADLPVKVTCIAKATETSRNHLYDAIKKGEIRSVRVGRTIRIPAAEARRLLGWEVAA
ncbi:hypothetical protein GCM10007036_10580 [Alsobacter metallidurans]|uniref:Helix-turn-helix domain-containing protein n=1 Tax=Alsobacter metallidurans TaxID=340221 RepID=A0A917I474_9HYPH|nr:excisionase family DNA-binding protein [Alsobacter metallidurans]GGH12602.1 hypothetical protein GCM10007036_10580 [Alsobacter metallidurans]